jgi:hypothetical protein
MNEPITIYFAKLVFIAAFELPERSLTQPNEDGAFGTLYSQLVMFLQLFQSFDIVETLSDVGTSMNLAKGVRWGHDHPEIEVPKEEKMRSGVDGRERSFWR